MTSAKVNAVKESSHPVTAAFVQIWQDTWTGVLDNDFGFFWAEHQKGYTQSFAPKRELEVDTLYQLFQKFREASLEIPSELGKDMLDIPMPVAVTWGDATSSVEHREAVLKMLVDVREQTVKCHAPGDAEKIDELFKASGVCTKA